MSGKNILQITVGQSIPKAKYSEGTNFLWCMGDVCKLRGYICYSYLCNFQILCKVAAAQHSPCSVIPLCVEKLYRGAEPTKSAPRGIKMPLLIPLSHALLSAQYCRGNGTLLILPVGTLIEHASWECLKTRWVRHRHRGGVRETSPNSMLRCCFIPKVVSLGFSSPCKHDELRRKRRR